MDGRAYIKLKKLGLYFALADSKKEDRSVNDTNIFHYLKHDQDIIDHCKILRIPAGGGKSWLKLPLFKA